MECKGLFSEKQSNERLPQALRNILITEYEEARILHEEETSISYRREVEGKQRNIFKK